MTDDVPGIRRRRAGRGFSYRGPDGQLIRDEKTLARVKSLAIPPAWTDVWIAPHPRAHVQATGRDKRGRKQYRYHAEFRQVRDAVKFDHMIAFAEALPRIRQRVQRDLALPGLSRQKVLAACVRVMEETHIRVGNDEYRRQNRSFGLTTLQDRHARITSSSVRFRFKGKHGIVHEVAVTDRRLARLVKRCQDLPGQELFQYVDETGTVHDVTSGDVNEYLREISGLDITAKDFRTWAGTVLAARFFHAIEPAETKKELRSQVIRTIEQVAARLGNTVAICRKCYVHPAVIDAFLAGQVVPASAPAQHVVPETPEHGLSAEEHATLAFLRDQQGSADTTQRRAA